MLAGFGSHLSMYVAGIFANESFFKPYRLMNFDPIIVGLFVSFATTYLVTLFTPAPPLHLVQKYFYKRGGELKTCPSCGDPVTRLTDTWPTLRPQLWRLLMATKNTKSHEQKRLVPTPHETIYSVPLRVFCGRLWVSECG